MKKSIIFSLFCIMLSMAVFAADGGRPVRDLLADDSDSSSGLGSSESSASSSFIATGFTHGGVPVESLPVGHYDRWVESRRVAGQGEAFHSPAVSVAFEALVTPISPASPSEQGDLGPGGPLSPASHASTITGATVATGFSSEKSDWPKFPFSRKK